MTGSLVGMDIYLQPNELVPGMRVRASDTGTAFIITGVEVAGGRVNLDVAQNYNIDGKLVRSRSKMSVPVKSEQRFVLTNPERFAS